MTEEEETLRQAEERKRLLGRPSRARYDRVRSALLLKWRRRALEKDRMMREVVDELWDRFAGSPYSWCGFYVLSQDGQRLELGPHRDKPAATPLALKGVCGRALKEGRPIVVGDVRKLGEGYVACDPATRSEIAVPVFGSDGKAWGVFDADSDSLDAFDQMDERWLERILKRFEELEG